MATAVELTSNAGVIRIAREDQLIAVPASEFDHLLNFIFLHEFVQNFSLKLSELGV
jgi:hypothetical protein